MANPNAPGFFTGASGRTPGENTQDLYVVSGVVTGQNLVLTMSNGTTVTISLTSIFTAIDAEDLTGVSFNTATRTLTVNQGSRSFSATIPDTVIPEGDNFYVTSGTYSVSDDTITLTRNDGGTVSIDLSQLVAQIVDDTNTHIQSGVVSGNNMTLTLNDNSTVTVDVTTLQNSNVAMADLLTGTPASGDVAYYNGTNWVPQAFTDSDTTYEAGAGITITDTEISIGDTDVTNAMLAGDIAIGKLDTDGTLVTINTVAMNPGGSYTITAQPAPVFPSHLSGNLAPALVEVGTGTQQMDLTLSVPTGYTIRMATVSITDTAGHPLSVTTIDSEHYRATAPKTSQGSIGATWVATVRRNSDDSEVILRGSTSSSIRYGWYSAFTTTKPTARSGMTDNGVWHSGDHCDNVAPAGASKRVWIALPTRSAGYTFRSGIAFLDFTADGVFDTNWTIYYTDEFTHFATGEEVTITVTEN